MNAKDFITRKEMTALSPLLTYDRIRRHEAEWGLADARLQCVQRPVMYDRSKVILILIRLGLIQESTLPGSPTTP
jgi:hypothetical protein